MKKRFSLIGIVLAIILCFSVTACGKTADTKYMHLSIDDNVFCFEDLAKNDYDSLFDQPYFGKLKELHDEYGAVVSLYTYNKTLEKVSDKYAEEFKANASWLKVGLHANEHLGMNLNEYVNIEMAYVTSEDATGFWNDFTQNVNRVCGSLDSLDKMPRLEYYCGPLDYVKGLRDAENGALGFLVRGDGVTNYMYYDESVATQIKTDNYVEDKDNKLTLVGTDLTIESLLATEPAKPNFKDLTADDISSVKPLETLNGKMTDANFANGPFIVFSHEYCYYYGESVLPTFAWLESACEFAKTNQIPFAFSQDMLI